MSNQYTAPLGAHSLRLSPRAAAPANSIWRRLFGAWLRAYGNRLDGNHNVVCEL